MKYQNLIGQIDSDINTNGNRGITGAKLNSVLNEMVSVLGDGFRIAGEVYPYSEAPTDTDNGLCYIAKTAGTYTNFGNVMVRDFEFAIIYYDSDNEYWNTMGWERKDFGLVIVDRSTAAKFGENEMKEIRKDVAFIIRSGLDGADDGLARLFVKDMEGFSGYWFYSAPVMKSDLAGDLILSQGYINVDAEPSEDETYHYTVGKSEYNLPIKENVEYALSLKQNTLTFDTTPTAGSTNPVTSGGIKLAIDAVPRGITDYDGLDNRPQIGGVTLTGNKTAEQLGLATINDITWEEN